MQLKFLTSVCGWLLLIQLAMSQVINPTNSEDFDIEYISCDNIISIDVVVYNDHGYHDLMHHFKLAYWDETRSEWRQFFVFSDSFSWELGAFSPVLIRQANYYYGYYGLGTDTNRSTYPGTENGRTRSGSKISLNVLFPVPQGEMGDELQIKLYDAVWANYYCCGGANTHHELTPHTLTSLPTRSLPNVSDLSATTDECQQVTLNWTSPRLSVLQTCDNYNENSGTIQIFRDNELIRTLEGSVQSYVDEGRRHGVPHEYEVRFYYGYEGNSNLRHSSGEIVTANAKRRAYAPENLTVSRNECKQIILNWSPRDTDVRMNRIEMKRISSDNWSVVGETSENNFNLQEENYPVESPILWSSILDEDMEFRVSSVFDCTGDLIGDYSFNSPYHEESEKYSDVGIGKAVSDPSSPQSVMGTILVNKIRISWNPASTNEDSFIIRRINSEDVSDIVEVEVPSGVDFYDDENINSCVEYHYNVRSANVCSEVDSEQIDVTYPPNLSSVFGELRVSKGYYADNVQLNWEFEGRSHTLIDNILIERKEVGGVIFATLETVSINRTSYTDLSANSGVLYDYRIRGVRDCNGTTVYSNNLIEKGFRLSSGTVSGNIAYRGGTGSAVAGVRVRVIADNAMESISQCLSFNGIDNYGIIEDTSIFDDHSTVEFWAFSTDWTSDVYLYHSPVQSLSFNSQEIIFSLTTSEGTTMVLNGGTPGLNSGWHHFATSFDGLAQKLYIDGIEVGSSNTCSSGCNLVKPNSGTFYLGSETTTQGFFTGRIDELRIWGKSKSSDEIRRDHTRYVLSNADSLRVHWSFDEGMGNYGYDRSYTGTNSFHERHLNLSANNLWSSDVPLNNQLSPTGITDVNGNYTIRNIYYTGIGQSFSLTPILGIHDFSPPSRVLFIGDGSIVSNNQDFVDQSSFTVTGSIKYEGTSAENGTGGCATEGIFIRVDGQIAVQAGMPVMSDENGNFTISVPIGRHTITAFKNGHTFSTGQFPTDGGTYNFNDHVSGIEFIDNTSMKVIGRVVGGNTEANKTLGFDYSANNIGQAEITFTTTDNCFTTTVTTDAITGEYEIGLPPLTYIVERNIPSNASIDFGDLRQLDLSSTPPLQYLYADGADENTENESMRMDYNAIHSYTYYSPLELIVSDSDEDISLDVTTVPQLGEDTFIYTDAMGEETSVDLSSLPYPVFLQNQYYSVRVGVYERYINQDDLDNLGISIVGVTGSVLTITNNLASNSTSEEIDLGNKHDTLYVFRGGNPELLENGVVPDYSFTKTFEIVAEDDTRTTAWMPLESNSAGEDMLYRGYVFGGKSEGNSFSTQGPEMVDHVLRDPPGSGSYSSLGIGSIESSAYEWSLGASAKVNFNAKVLLGTNISIGLGVATNTKVQNILDLGLSVSTDISGGGKYVEKKELMQEWSTSPSPDFVGADADVFIGSSRNFDYGLASFLELIPVNICTSVDGVECFGDEISGYKLGTRQSLYLVPEGYATSFIYTQRHIEEEVVPTLESLRNQLFLGANYTSHLPSNNESYGTNNDDPVWGSMASTDDPIVSSIEDRNGPSYLYTPSDDDMDSVRLFNQQIRLWKEAISNNEKSKLQVQGLVDSDEGMRLSPDDFLNQNISISSGTSYDYTSTSTSIDTETFSFELLVEQSIGLLIVADVGGNGVEVEQSVEFGQKLTQGTETEEENSTTYSYHLEDGDEGNTLSVDVYNALSPGNGTIFFMRGGETSCPHEKEQRTKYYETGTYTLSGGTISLDQPSISISPSNIVGVKANETAVFSVTIGNLSEIERTYRLDVRQSSNPFGAVIRINGLNPNQSFRMSPRSQTTLQLTVDRGQTEYIYEDLTLIFRSDCDEDTYDETQISVEFLPVCSEVSLLAPDNNFVVNTNSENTLDLVIGEYDLQKNDLERIELQYRRVGSPNWIIKEIFYNETEDTESTNLRLSESLPYTLYSWIMTDVPDGQYELRAVSVCDNGSTTSSTTIIGTVDRLRPRAFGTPSPSDGVLSAGEDIQVRFNESIAGGLVSHFDIEVTGRLNEGVSYIDVTPAFDGVNDEVVIPTNSYLYNQGFTVEFWFKKSGDLTRKQVMFSHGSSSQGFHIYLNETNQIVADMNGELLVATTSVVDDLWHHVAFTFNERTFEGQLYLDSNPIGNMAFSGLFFDTGRIILGRSISGTNGFSGNLADLRVWSLNKNEASITADRYILLNPKNPNLLGHWLMDEGERNVMKDRVRSLNGKLLSGTWQASTSGWSANFDTNSYLEIPSENIVIGQDQGFTIEFWFNAEEQRSKTIFSNGRADGTDGYSTAWLIGTNENGDISIQNNGTLYVVPNSSSYFDNEWHHFALVLNRFVNMNVLIDGGLVETFPVDNLTGFGASTMWIGTRGYYAGFLKFQDRHFNGSIDEFRLWSMSRMTEQIDRDKMFRLNGNETGLIAYIPFDLYVEDAGVSVLNFSWQEIVSQGEISSRLGVEESQNTPLIKIPVSKQSVNFDFAINADELGIDLNEPQYRIENVTLDITLSNIQDIYGNRIAEPVSWIAYVDQNQLTWKNPFITKKIPFGGQELHTLALNIVNTGGRLVDYEISNLPDWMTIVSSSGSIGANSEQEITFSISENLNIGHYHENISLLASGSDLYDNLSLEVHVRPKRPTFEDFDPDDFEYFMDIVAEVEYNETLLGISDVLIVALIDGQVRGMVEMTYEETLDKYLAYLRVYSNEVTESQPILFKIWNPLTAISHTADDPSDLIFSNGGVMGDPLNPLLIRVGAAISEMIHWDTGWNWISFNVFNPNLFDYVTTHMVGSRMLIKSQTEFAVYSSEGDTWSGSLENFVHGKAYMVYVDQPQDFVYYGMPLDSEDNPITIRQGWNWIGLYGTQTLQIDEALASYTPQYGDIVRGMDAFSVYGGNGIGWLGQLESLKQNKGYMLKYRGLNEITQLIFPANSSVGSSRVVSENLINVSNPNRMYENNMMIIARINVDIEEGEVGRVLSSFVGNELRGSAYAIPFSNDEDQMFFLTIQGNIDEHGEVDFVMDDGGKEPMILVPAKGHHIYYESNEVIGSLDNPLILAPKKESNVEEPVIEKMFPNGFNDFFVMDINFQEKTNLIINLYDNTGKQVKKLYHGAIDKGNRRFRFEDMSGLPSGIYVCVVKTEKTINIHKLIKD